MKKAALVIVYIFVGFLAISQESSSISVHKDQRLNGHKFSQIGQLTSSFVQTGIHTNIGIGSSSPIRIAGVVIDDVEILAFEGKLLFVNTDVRYQQRFNHWLALYFHMKLSGRVGVDMSTIVADGINTLSGAEIGWMIKLYKNNKFNFSTKLGVRNMTGNFINVKGYFEDLVNKVPDPTVIKKVPVLNTTTGVQAAYAFNSSWGLQFFTDLSYGESLEQRKNDLYFSAGILGSFDLYPKNEVPLGFNAGYVLTAAPEIVMDNEGSSNMFIAKINYTGAEEFDLGLMYSIYELNLKSLNEQTNINRLMINISLYF